MKVPDFGVVTTEHDGTVLEARAIIPGKTLHDLVMVFHNEKIKAKPGDEYAGDPGRWPEVRGVKAVVEEVLKVVYGSL